MSLNYVYYEERNTIQRIDDLPRKMKSKKICYAKILFRVSRI